VALGVISALKTALYPFLPFSSQKLHRMMGFGGTIESDGWKLMLPTGGQKLGEPEPLFTKLDENLVDEETARLGQA
jgi:methionyl-tRNA synthetase